jgi:hypothetical protein
LVSINWCYNQDENKYDQHLDDPQEGHHKVARFTSPYGLAGFIRGNSMCNDELFYEIWENPCFLFFFGVKFWHLGLVFVIFSP